HDLKDAGYVVDRIPQSPRALLDMLDHGGEDFSIDDYKTYFAELPVEAREAVTQAWGPCEIPLSGLPAISPTKGERGSFGAGSPFAASKIGESVSPNPASP